MESAAGPRLPLEQGYGHVLLPIGRRRIVGLWTTRQDQDLVGRQRAIVQSDIVDQTHEVPVVQVIVLPADVEELHARDEPGRGGRFLLNAIDVQVVRLALAHAGTPLPLPGTSTLYEPVFLWRRLFGRFRLCGRDRRNAPTISPCVSAADCSGTVVAVRKQQPRRRFGTASSGCLCITMRRVFARDETRKSLPFYHMPSRRSSEKVVFQRHATRVRLHFVGEVSWPNGKPCFSMPLPPREGSRAGTHDLPRARTALRVGRASPLALRSHSDPRKLVAHSTLLWLTDNHQPSTINDRGTSDLCSKVGGS